MFEQVDISSLEINPFSLLDTDNFLITAGDEKNWNTMTAAWGFMGVMWARRVFAVVVRDTRHTYEFLDNCDTFTVSFFPPEFQKALLFCGTHSGRDTDKAAETGLVPVTVENGEGGDYVTFGQANLIFCCTKASKTAFDPSQFIDPSIGQHYPQKDYHRLFIGYIDQVLVSQE